MFQSEASAALIPGQRRRVPQPHRSIHAGGSQSIPVTAESDTRYLGETSKCEHLPAGVRIPKFDGSVVSRRSQAPVIGAKGQADHEVIVCLEGNGRSAQVLHRPDLHRTVEAGSGQALAAVAAEDDTTDGRSQAPKQFQATSALDVPDADESVTVAGSAVTTVRAEGHAEHGPCGFKGQALHFLERGCAPNLDASFLAGKGQALAIGAEGHGIRHSQLEDEATRPGLEHRGRFPVP